MIENWTIPELEALAEGALMRSGTEASIATSVARALVAAEVDGQQGHGLRRLESYCPQVRSGKVDGTAVPRLTKTALATARIDAQAGFAYPALDMAIDWIARTAPKTGIASTGIFHSHHCGVAGHWTERLAQRGLVALMFANAPAAIPPAGGSTPLFGTNPIAFAAPGVGADPLVIDLSLSKVARGKIMAAKQKGEAIPEGWALDSSGRPTTDPAAAMAGSMLPIGDAKGAALVMMVEILSAGLTGANWAKDASSFFDSEGAPPGTGQLIIAISPEATGGPGFKERLAALGAAILAQPGTRLPGMARIARRDAAKAKGLSVDTSLIDTIRAI